MMLLVTVLLLMTLVVVYRGQVRIRHLKNILAFYAVEWESPHENPYVPVPSARLLTDGGDRATEAVGWERGDDRR